MKLPSQCVDLRLKGHLVTPNAWSSWTFLLSGNVVVDDRGVNSSGIGDSRRCGPSESVCNVDVGSERPVRLRDRRMPRDTAAECHGETGDAMVVDHLSRELKRAITDQIPLEVDDHGSRQIFHDHHRYCRRI